MDNIKLILLDIKEYSIKVFQPENVFIGGILAILEYIFIPSQAFAIAISAWLVSVIIDLITKMYALSKKCRHMDLEAKGLFKVVKWIAPGYYNATHSKSILSSKLWDKTKRKFFEFGLLTVMLSILHRMTFASAFVEIFTAVVFTVAFLREWQSVFENLLEADHDVKWILVLIGKVKKLLNKKLE